MGRMGVYWLGNKQPKPTGSLLLHSKKSKLQKVTQEGRHPTRGHKQSERHEVLTLARLGDDRT